MQNPTIPWTSEALHNHAKFVEMLNTSKNIKAIYHCDDEWHISEVYEYDVMHYNDGNVDKDINSLKADVLSFKRGNITAASLIFSPKHVHILEEGVYLLYNSQNSHQVKYFAVIVW